MNEVANANKDKRRRMIPVRSDKQGEVPPATSPAVQDEESFAGSASAPLGEDAADIAHEAGLYLEDDDEDPAELGIAEQVEHAEKLRRGE